MADKYDKAIEWLKKNPQELEAAWLHATTHVAGCLFLFLTPSGATEGICGCPTMVKAGQPACNLDLEKMVLTDDRVPDEPEKITLESLPAFAEIQRYADATIRDDAAAKGAGR